MEDLRFQFEAGLLYVNDFQTPISSASLVEDCRCSTFPERNSMDRTTHILLPRVLITNDVVDVFLFSLSSSDARIKTDNLSWVQLILFV